MFQLFSSVCRYIFDHLLYAPGAKQDALGAPARREETVTTRDNSHGCDLSRRTVLGVIGLGGIAALLSGCETQPEFPDPVMLPHKSNLADRDGYVAPAPTTRLAEPPTTRPPNNFGIIPRSAWTREGPNMATIAPMNGARLITFHHAGDPKPFTTTDYTETAQHLEWVRAYHRSRGFKDIGYHFAIDRAGRVWQLRSLAYQGEHTRNNNEHNIGIVVIGNFDMQTMSAAQQEKVIAFASLVRNQYRLGANRVYTHQEIVTTECPGDNMQAFMVAIRKRKLI
jgi:hypothetical protein